MVSNSLAATARRTTKRATWRRAARSPRLANVIMRSASRRVSLALARVVSIRSCWNSEVVRLRSSERRWAAVRLSLRWSLRCRIGLAFYPDGALVLEVPAHVHAERQAHLAQDVLDLLQRLAAEVAELEHLRLALLDQIADGLDLGGAEAVARAHRELQLLDALVEQPAHPHDLLVDLLLHLLLDRLLEVDEEVEMVAQDLGRHRHGVGRQDAAVGPHVDGELVVVDALPQARGLDVV